jgi:hypothetical protein
MSKVVLGLKPMQRPEGFVPLGRDPRRSQRGASEPGAPAVVPKGMVVADYCLGEMRRECAGMCREAQRRGHSAGSPAFGVCVSFGDSETMFLSAEINKAQRRAANIPPAKADSCQPTHLTCTSDSCISRASFLRSRGPRYWCCWKELSKALTCSVVKAVRTRGVRVVSGSLFSPGEEGRSPQLHVLHGARALAQMGPETELQLEDYITSPPH